MRTKKSREPIKLEKEEINALVSVLKEGTDDDDIAQFLVATTRDGIKKKRLEAKAKIDSGDSVIGSKIRIDEKTIMEQLILNAFSELPNSDKLRVINDFIINHQEGLGPTVKEVINTFETEEKKEEIKFKHYAAKMILNVGLGLVAVLIILFVASILFNNGATDMEKATDKFNFLSAAIDVIKLMFFTKLD